MAGFISITLQPPNSPVVKRSKGGVQFMASALEANLKTASVQVQGAITAAIQYAVNETKTLAVQQLSSKVACDRRQIESRVTSRPVTIRSSSWSIRIRQKRIDLKHFLPIQTKAGVSVNTGYRSRFYKGAFGPDIKRLGGNVFRRKTRDHLPISKIHGVSLVSVAKSIGLQAKLQQKFYHTARVRIKRNMALVSFLGADARGLYGVS
jgi:hypothetical protein